MYDEDSMESFLDDSSEASFTGKSILFSKDRPKPAVLSPTHLVQAFLKVKELELPWKDVL